MREPVTGARAGAAGGRISGHGSRAQPPGAEKLLTFARPTEAANLP